jgi:hypothetical protein
MRNTVIALATVLVIGLIAEVEAGKTPVDVVGSWYGATSSVGKLSGVGKEKAEGSLDLAMGETDWSAEDHNGIEFSGTWTRRKNKLFLEFDSAGRAGLEESVMDWLEHVADAEGVSLEDLSVTLDKIKPKAAAKSSRKKGESVKFSLLVKFTSDAFVDGDPDHRKGSMKVKGTLTPD